MKRKFQMAMLILGIVLALFCSSSVTHAQSHSALKFAQSHTASKANEIDYCEYPNFCTYYNGWHGNTYGEFVQHTLSNPTFNTSKSYWAEYVALRIYPYALKDSIEIGFEKTSSAADWYPGYCGNTGNKLTFFIKEFDPGGRGDDIICTPNVNSDNINQQYIVQTLPKCCINGFNYYAITVSMHDGQQWVENLTCDYTDTCATGMEYILYIDQFMDKVNNYQHWQWGTKWDFSEWCTSDGNCTFQSRAVDTVKVDKGPPPAMYWPTEPSPTNSGGEMYTCIYDSLANGPCTYNG